MRDANALKDDVAARIDKVKPSVQKVSADIHAHPEVGYEEHQACMWLTDLLSAHGFQVERKVADLDTAFRAEYRGGDGPTIALLAEYDALPGIGHGCGHNLICTASSAAAIGLKDGWPDLPGTIVVMGTPAEEGGGGKIVMLDRGGFDGVDMAMMFHPGNANRANSPLLASGFVTFTFTGKASHSSVAPWLGRNAADAAMLFFAGVNALRQHVRPSTRLHGVITEAGSRPNIVPAKSRIEFQVRSETSESMEEIMDRVMAIANGAALMSGTTLAYERGLTYLDMRTCPTLGSIAEANFRRLGLATVPVTPDMPRASADGGNVSHAMPHLGIGLSISDKPVPGHSEQNREAAISAKGQEAMINAAKILAFSCIDILAEPSVLDTVRREHELVMSGFKAAQLTGVLAREMDYRR